MGEKTPKQYSYYKLTSSYIHVDFECISVDSQKQIYNVEKTKYERIEYFYYDEELTEFEKNNHLLLSGYILDRRMYLHLQVDENCVNMLRVLKIEQISPDEYIKNKNNLGQCEFLNKSISDKAII